MTWSHAYRDVVLVEIAYFLLFFLSDSLSGMLSHAARGSLTFSGRKAARSGPWWPKTLNLCMRVSWQNRCYGTYWRLLGRKARSFQWGTRPRTYRWARCRPALAGRPGASKNSKTPFASLRHWPITLAGSRSRREKHVCDAFKKVVPGSTDGLETGRCAREGREGVEKVQNAGCVRASRPITFAGSSVPTGETCVRCF